MIMAIGISCMACSSKLSSTSSNQSSVKQQSQKEIDYENISASKLKKLADTGDTTAAYYLAVCYDYGAKDIGQDYQLAYSYYQKAADASVTDANLALGYLYMNGCGVDKNLDTATSYFNKAISEENFGGYVGLGRIALLDISNDAAKKSAYDNILMAYNKGNLDALYFMGYLYENGIGCERDYQKAMLYYLDAATTKSTAIVDQYAINSAYTQLGIMCVKAYGVEQNYDLALKYFTKAADNHYPRAMYYEGLMYENGLGVDKDYEEAMSCFTQAAEFDYAPALNQIGYFYFNGLGVEVDYDQALYYQKLAAAQGYVLAQVNLGYLYENGLGVDKNLQTALAYYQMAAAENYEGANEAIARVEKLLQE